MYIYIYIYLGHLLQGLFPAHPALELCELFLFLSHLLLATPQNGGFVVIQIGVVLRILSVCLSCFFLCTQQRLCVRCERTWHAHVVVRPTTPRYDRAHGGKVLLGHQRRGGF